MTNRQMNETKDAGRAAYEKPAIVHREKMDVLAVVCDSQWIPTKDCRKPSDGGCVKTRL